MISRRDGSAKDCGRSPVGRRAALHFPAATCSDAAAVAAGNRPASTPSPRSIARGMVRRDRSNADGQAKTRGHAGKTARRKYPPTRGRKGRRPPDGAERKPPAGGGESFAHPATGPAMSSLALMGLGTIRRMGAGRRACFPGRSGEALDARRERWRPGKTGRGRADILLSLANGRAPSIPEGAFS